MEKSFLVESKIFDFSVLDRASRLRVGEKRKSFSGKIVISPQCSEWLALMLEILLGFPEDQEFIKSSRKGSKILIARGGSNHAGRFLEAAVFGLGGQKGLILISEGRVGWGWLKFSDELRKAAAFLFAKMDSGAGSPYVSVNNEGKEEEAKMGMFPCWKGPSFVEVLRSGSLPFVGGRHSRLSAMLAETCVLDFLPSVRHAKDDLRTAVDCFSLESPPLELLNKYRLICPLGKKLLSHSNLKFEFSKRLTWRKLGIRSNLALGRAVRNILDCFVGTGLGRKRSGFRLARFLLKLLASRPLKIMPEMSLEISSGISLVRPPSGGWEDTSLDTIEGVGMSSSGLLGCPLLPETMEVVPETVNTGIGPLGVSVERMDKNGVEPEGFDGVSRGLRKAREELAPGISSALSSSRGGSIAGPSLPSVFLGFLGSVVGLPENSSLLPTLETFSSHTDSLSSDEMDEKLTLEWEIDVRKKVAGLWERFSQEYAGYVTEEHNERFRAITEEMMKRKKTKGKKELLNLQSSVTYGDSKSSSRCKKCKTHVI
jgi:hypothetical protein